LEELDGYAVEQSPDAVSDWSLALTTRLRNYFDLYTYQPKRLLESIIKPDEETKPFTRSTPGHFW